MKLRFPVVAIIAISTFALAAQTPAAKPDPQPPIAAASPFIDVHVHIDNPVADASTPSYQSVPTDNPLFMLLTDIAAAHNMPITLHMEAVSKTMPIPESWHVKNPPNPAQLPANMAAFEKLLAHNPAAKIIWAHAGWDNTGDRTPEL